MRALPFLFVALTTACPAPPNVADAPSSDVRLPIGTSGALCPDSSTLTWDTFGQTFVTTYCVRCHSSMLVGAAARTGAPPGLNWDIHANVIANAARIDTAAGAGPVAVNTFMPFNGLAPPEAERRMLAEWLACGAP